MVDHKNISHTKTSNFYLKYVSIYHILKKIWKGRLMQCNIQIIYYWLATSRTNTSETDKYHDYIQSCKPRWLYEYFGTSCMSKCGKLVYLYDCRSCFEVITLFSRWMNWILQTSTTCFGDAVNHNNFYFLVLLFTSLHVYMACRGRNM
jgi:hypothetical protein